jgi:hypothetical protein
VKTYWITGSIQNCQRRFVEQFGGRNSRSKRCIQLLVAGCIAVSFRVDYLYLILSFRVANFLFANFQNTQPHKSAIHLYCTFVLFVNQHFPGLPASGTLCIKERTRVIDVYEGHRVPKALPRMKRNIGISSSLLYRIQLQANKQQ